MTTQYLTIPDAIAKLGKQLYRMLGVTEGSDVTGNVNLLSALESANARIDSALRGRYPIPFTDLIPSALVQPAVDLFRYYLLGIMQQSVSVDDRMRYEDAEKFLGRLSRGEDRLDLSGIEEAPAQSVTAVAGRTGQINPATYDGYFSGVGYDVLGPARRC